MPRRHHATPGVCSARKSRTNIGQTINQRTRMKRTKLRLLRQSSHQPTKFETNAPLRLGHTRIVREVICGTNSADPHAILAESYLHKKGKSAGTIRLRRTPEDSEADRRTPRSQVGVNTPERSDGHISHKLRRNGVLPGSQRCDRHTRRTPTGCCWLNERCRFREVSRKRLAPGRGRDFENGKAEDYSCRRTDNFLPSAATA